MQIISGSNIFFYTKVLSLWLEYHPTLKYLLIYLETSKKECKNDTSGSSSISQTGNQSHPN